MTDAAVLRAPDSTAEVTSQTGRIASLDGLRGVAILMVMLHHFTMSLGLSTRIEAAGLFVTRRLGVVGVELFFVLSGFLITGIFWDSKGRSGRDTLRVFYARRILRIFPLYYGVIACVALAGALIPGLGTPGWHRFLGDLKYLLSYATNIIRDLYGKGIFYDDWFDFSHFWTLAVEENFYLIWPWVLLCSSRRGAIAACGVLLLASLGLQAWAAQGGGGLLFALTATPRQAGSLVIGSALALWLRGRRGAGPGLESSPFVLIFCSVGYLALFVNDAFGVPILEVLQRLLLGLTFACLIARLVARPQAIEREFFESRVFRFFGKYSYGLYIFHHLFFPVWLRLMDSLSQSLGNYRLAALIVIGIATTVSVGLSLLSWSLFERPILGLKRYFEYDAGHADLAVAAE